jgi:transcriptional regulator with XRE-family HTH domain
MTPTTLKAFRDEQRLTQQALASLLGVNRVTLADWERGRSPSPSYLGLALAAIRASLTPVE